MRRTILLFALLATCGLSLATVASAQGEAVPKAVPVEPVKDLAIVPKGELIVHQFLIRNEGNAPLELTDVHPACGCTVAEFDRVVPPGGVGKVTAKLDTSSFNGPISKSIAVLTNDPANPKLQLVIKAEVKPYVNAYPGFARFNYVQGETTGTISQNLWSEDGHPLKVLKVTAPYPHLKVGFHEAKEESEKFAKANDKQQWRVDITIDAQSPIGALRDYVLVETDHPKQKEVQIAISGFVRPRQHVTPEKVDFGTLEGASLPLKRTLAFTNFATKGIQLTKIDTGHVGVNAAFVETGNIAGHRFQLTLEISPNMPKGAFSSVVKVHTTDEQMPVIEIPINGTIL